MKQFDKYTLPSMLQNSYKQFAQLPALYYVGEDVRTYSDLQKEVNQLAVLLQQKGFGQGDKIGILSSNMPNWGIAFFAIATIGGVAVPILPDFSTNEITNILTHAEAKALFVSESLFAKVENLQIDSLNSIFLVENFAIIPPNTNKADLANLPSIEINAHLQPSFTTVAEDDLASIIYTSGTTGKSKGVMLTHKNLTWDAAQCITIQPVGTTDRFLSMLPLSHTFENTLGLILPIMFGASVQYMKKPPTPNLLLSALKIAKPTIVLTVPLIIEKIYKRQIEPKFSKGILKYLYKIPVIRKLLNRVAGKKLYEALGGELLFFGIGGAKVDGVVEQFLIEAKFPYAIGYGLTETSPMLAGAASFSTRWQGVGPAMKGVEIKIDSPNTKTGEGEVWAKGPNVMKGYYKEPELTAEVLSPDGWFRTGDLGSLDSDGFLHIRGRLKNIIIGSSGENIYPEEIESVINNFKFVVESLVVERKGRLVALVLLNMEELQAKYHLLREQADSAREQAEQYYNQKIDEITNELLRYVNAHVSKFSQLQLVMVQEAPFERTPTQKIKRFLYE